MVELNKLPIYKKLFTPDSNGREINVYRLTNIQLAGDTYYPNCLIYSNSVFYDPLDERIMSLNIKIEKDTSVNKFIKIEKNPVFFFIYNTDNYYHFIYDTLPYLISFRELKNEIKELKLLMNYPNFQSNKLYSFVVEFLEILGINSSDIIISDKDTLYTDIYVSSSYTHGFDSNLPPRSEVYGLYKEIVNIVNTKFIDDKEYPSKIYISRRTWINNDDSNIGTNYTSKRKLVNEDDLVKLLNSTGYVEVFSENLSTIDKIKMFSKAKYIIGAIGGGLCNVLFSNEDTELIALVSPTFLEINKRFEFSLSKVNVFNFKDSKHFDRGSFKRFMRVYFENRIGEIEEVYHHSILVAYTDNFVAGWNNNFKLKRKKISKKNCLKLDNGLNSPWVINIKKIKKILNEKHIQ
jgi:hypothetical protein